LRILFLTNYYLTQVSGGEEQSCIQVVEGLKQRGHTALVLTSMVETNNVPVESDGIFRSLYLEMDLVPWRNSFTFFTKRKVREKHNLQRLEGVFDSFKPDIIFIWGMWNLHKSLPALAEARYPDKVIYRFANYWPTLPSQSEIYWRIPGRNWASRIPKRMLSYFALSMLAKEHKQLALKYKHSICVSVASRDTLVNAGVPVSNAKIIYTGLDVRKFTHRGTQLQKRDDRRLRLLFAGRLAPDKGIETAIKAMTKLVFDNGFRDIQLSLVGSGPVDYENQLRHLVQQERVSEYVSFLGWVIPDRMPDLLRSFDVLLMTSTWAEPFARVLLEGMISGLVIIATPTGGTPEIVLDGHNGLLFESNNPEDLAQKITLLRDDPELRQHLAVAGIKTVREKFTITKMMDEVESFLQEIACASAPMKGVDRIFQRPPRSD
jgi:glycogen(starch) synthase